LAFLALETPIH